jgi:hypothetical protein
MRGYAVLLSLFLAVTVAHAQELITAPGWTLVSHESEKVGVDTWSYRTAAGSTLEVTRLKGAKMPKSDLARIIRPLKTKSPESLRPLEFRGWRGYAWWLNFLERSEGPFLMTAMVVRKGDVVDFEVHMKRVPTLLEYAAFERIVRSLR